MNFSWVDAFTISVNFYWGGTNVDIEFIGNSVGEEDIQGISFGILGTDMIIVLYQSISAGVAAYASVELSELDVGWHKVRVAYDPYPYVQGQDYDLMVGNTIRYWIDDVETDVTYSNAEGSKMGAPSTLQGGNPVTVGGTPTWGSGADEFRLSQLKVFTGIVEPQGALRIKPSPMHLSTLLKKPKKIKNMWKRHSSSGEATSEENNLPRGVSSVEG